MSQAKYGKKVVIGWSEYVDFPEWGIKGIKAKIDTGARTSSIHVDSFELLPRRKVRFNVVLSRTDSNKTTEVVAPYTRIGRVKSSTGHASDRIFVKTRISLGHFTETVELNLVDRKKMKFRMLLGRSAFRHHFLVDVSRSYILTKKKKIKTKD